ncbi:hypothetical protein TIFTF001_036418 [Ficus carica]|uniref:Ubiquitin-like protease family profile domain-containing protein n=1 Tax=Ficus carica TaxID=3494 RepID=A0AA88JB69_FICCA|nr:hypothetical protein TIFTF001_036418 [Ficus carica]
MLSANIIEKGEGKAEPALPVSSIHEINAERVELDAMKTTSPDIGSVAHIGVQTAMEFLTADKVILSHEDAENDMNQQVDEGERIPEGEEMRDPGIQTKDENVEEEIILEQDFIKVAEPGNDDSGDVIPKKKRARLSRLGQRLARPMTDVGSPSIAPTKQPNPLSPGLADEPPQETLEEFKEWIKKGLLKRPPSGKRPPRYGAKYESFHKPHDLGFMTVANKAWYYKLATSPVWLWDEHIDVAFYYLRKKIRQYPELEKRQVTTVDTFFSVKVRGLWSVYQRSPETFDWDSCDSILRLMLGIRVQSDRLSLFEFKPKEAHETYPIPVTIMTDIPRQGNGGDCGIFTIKNAERLIKWRDVWYWVIQERMQIFREWMTCYLWGHARQKLEGQYKSDDDVDMDF